MARSLRRSPPRLVRWLTTALWLAGCGGSTQATPAPSAEPATPAPAPAQPVATAETPTTPQCPQTPGLCLAVEPAEAELTVDGAAKGPVGGIGPPGAAFLAVPPGIHQIVLSAPGHVTWRAEVTVAQTAERIDVVLEERAWDPLESTCRHASLSIL